MKMSHFATFIEKTVRWRVFGETLREAAARNAHSSPEAVAAVRTERFATRR